VSFPKDSWRRELRRLSARVARLEQAVLGPEAALEAALAERGLKVYRKDPTDRLLLPPGAPADLQERFYALMHRYSFRLLLRDVIRLTRFRAGDLTRFCSPRAAAGYVRFLAGAGVVEPAGEGAFSLVRPVGSLGPTLEWYVARLLEREFLAPAIYGVRFRNTAAGGDFDVIALLQGELAYAEVKSSPPKGIEVAEVRAYLRRLADLAPALSFFIVDTELRMKDKIVPLFEEATEGRAPVRLHGELFRLAPAVYIINSRKGIATNLRRCLLDARRREGR
jgi:hypothetical protein